MTLERAHSSREACRSSFRFLRSSVVHTTHVSVKAPVVVRSGVVPPAAALATWSAVISLRSTWSRLVGNYK